MYACCPRLSSCSPPQPFPVSSLSVELAPLDIDAVLADRHAEVLHGEHGAVLAAALAAAAVAGALDAERAALALVLGVGLRLAGYGDAGRHAEIAHGVVGRRVGRADPAVLVRVGRDVGHKLLRRERQQPRQPRVRLRRRRQARLGQVEVGDGIGDLWRRERARARAQALASKGRQDKANDGLMDLGADRVT
jgi:hypothetical protein